MVRMKPVSSTSVEGFAKASDAVASSVCKVDGLGQATPDKKVLPQRVRVMYHRAGPISICRTHRVRDRITPNERADPSSAVCDLGDDDHRLC